MKNKVNAHFSEKGVVVYQAFRPKTVEIAVEKGTFAKGFSIDRISWIKPSFGWMLHRSKYATKNRMTAIAKIWVSHEGFKEILSNSIQTHFDSSLFENEIEWQRKLKKSDVIHQWDPERSLNGRKLDYQAIQIGLRGEFLKKYRDEYILQVENVTDLALEIGALAKRKKNTFPEVPIEKEYILNPIIKNRLG